MNGNIFRSMLLSLLILCTACERPLNVEEKEREDVDTGASTALSMPRLTIPKNGRIITSAYQLWLRWGAILGAESYIVQVGTDSLFTRISFTATVETAYVLTPTLGTGNYYWRVKALGSEREESPWSLVQTFFVSGD